MEHTVELEFAGQTLKATTGKVAKQANGAIWLQHGDTIILATATMAKEAKPGLDFFPLTCDYEERKYAVGKIPGGFIKRGGRPGEKATLTSRLMDRPLRPLFPKGLRNETQVIAVPLSFQPEFPPDVLAVTAASFALSVSNIPFAGPVGCVRVGLDEEGSGGFILNPTIAQQQTNKLDLIVAGTRDAIIMVEAGASEVSETTMLAAMDFAMENVKKLVAMQDELAAKLGIVKLEPELHKTDQELLKVVRERFAADLRKGLQDPDKASREAGLTLLINDVVEKLTPEYPEQVADLREVGDMVVKEQLRDLILTEGKRPDGRGKRDIRPISCEVGLLPRVHGSGMFTRGQTQVLTTLTLGSGDEAQTMDTLEEDGEKHYMHFYNFPPYSVGEARPLRGPGRREIGHGALAERGLRSVIPSREDFPYTMLLTSEVLESNGSTSMASTCGSTLALLDAGVPIKSPVAGIAMGLIEGPPVEKGERQYAVLTDIQGMEDFSGDMDFKVAGTREGITALQLDTKIKGVPRHVFVEAFDQAKDARLFILDKITAAIPSHRENLSPYAPRIIVLNIDPDQIGTVIGPGGKTIKKITAETGAKIDIEQDGTVFIAAVDGAAGEAAKKMVEDLTRTIKPGDIFEGTVVRFLQFGAFVELVPGKDGLVHVSQLRDGEERIGKPEDVLKLGDKLRVRVTEIDPQGRVNLTAKGLDLPFDPANPEPGRPPRGDRGGDRGGPRDRDRGGRDRGGDRDRGPRDRDRGPRPGYNGGGSPSATTADAEAEAAAAQPQEDDELPRARFRPKR